MDFGKLLELIFYLILLVLILRWQYKKAGNLSNFLWRMGLYIGVSVTMTLMSGIVIWMLIPKNPTDIFGAWPLYFSPFIGFAAGIPVVYYFVRMHNAKNRPLTTDEQATENL